MPITISPNQIHIKKQDGSGFLPGNVVAGETTEQMCAAVEATGQATIDHVNQAVADAQSAVNTLDAQKNSIANTVASMAQLGTDTSLATPGMAADAAKTGEEVGNLKSAIDQTANIFSRNSEVLLWSKAADKAIKYNSGTEVASDDYSCTGFVYIKPFSSITYKRIAVTVGDTAGVAFYDESQTYISGTGVRNHQYQETTGYEDYTPEIPSNAYYARFTYFKANTYGEFSIIGTNRIDEINDDINEINADITEISTTTDGIRKLVPNFVEWQLNKAVVTNGDTVGDPIDATGAKCIVLDIEGIDCVTLVNGYGSSTSRPWCFIDNSGNKIQTASISTELFIKLYKPTGATKLVLNSSIQSGAFAVIGEYVDQQSVIDIESVNGIYGNLEKYMSIGGWSITGFLNRQYRLYSKPYITLGFDATVKCKPGYNIGVIYNDSGTIKDSGWLKAFKIPANTPFVVNVAKDPEDTTIIANVHELSMSFTLERTVNPLASNVFITDRDMISMHRGYMGDQTNIPENSVSAFEKSGELGAWMIETDIQETSDGYFVLMHDDTVDRTTTGTGTIASMTYVQTQELNLVGGDGTLKIPTLQQCLEVCKEWNLRATLEIKSILNGATSFGNILEIVKEYGMLDKVIFTFNSFTELEYFRTLNEDIPVMFNEDTASDYETAIATAQKYIKCGIAYRIQQVDGVYYPTKEINIKCHKNNLFVVGWTSSSWDAQKVWFAQGCDIVASNSNVKRPTEVQ